MAIDSGKKKEPDIDEVLTDLEHKIDRVKILYEQYFMGIEKLEPQTARKEITRKMLELTQMNIRNTAIRYRFNALTQKFGVYTTYWNRTLREIEKGTYYRNVAKAGRDAVRKGLDIPEEVLKAMPERMREKILKDRAAVAAKQARDQGLARDKNGGVKTPVQGNAVKGVVKVSEEEAGFDAKFDDLFDSMVTDDAKKPITKPPSGPPPAAAPPVAVKKPATAPPSGPPPSVFPPGVDETRAKELYKRYVQAKKLLGEDTSGLRYEQIVSTINKQSPQIMDKHKASGVDFEVVIKDNRVILKATPKK